MAIIDQSAVQSPVVVTPAPSTRPGSLITAPTCPASVVEAYHTLLTNVDLALGANEGRVVVVAAVDASADASIVAANLALVSAQGGDRTLLIDGDLHNAALGDLLGLKATPGLAQLLDGGQGGGDLRELAQPTELPMLGVVTAGIVGGRHNRLDRLGDLSPVVSRLKDAADRVIVTAAPVLSSTDVLRLAPLVDGILLAITPGRTRREDAVRARTLLDRAQAPVLGVALVPR